MRIVVRTPDGVGNTVLALPAIQTLKKHHPEAALWVAGPPWAQGLFPAGNGTAGFLPLSEEESVRDFRKSSRHLREADFSTGLLLADSFASALLFYVAGIPERWGYARDGRGFLLTRAVRGDHHARPVRHRALYYLDLLVELGFAPSEGEPRLGASRADRHSAEALLAAGGLSPAEPFILLSPGQAYGPARRWPVRHFIELANLIQSRTDANIVVSGSSDEAGLGNEIVSACARKAANLAGRTSLRDLIGLLSLAVVAVTNDAGPMHIANALGTPVAALFGPTDPAITGPVRPRAAVIKKAVPCWPCEYKACPYDHRCLSGIEAEEVFAALRQFL